MRDLLRDVHGIMFARVPGMWQCRQLRIAANRPNISPAVRGISFDAPEAARRYKRSVQSVPTISSKDVLNLLFGDAVGGLDQIRRPT